jgi:hypothetical protein
MQPANRLPPPAPFRATTYQGRPAIMDTTARVFYQCRTMADAQRRAAELNKVTRP